MHSIRQLEKALTPRNYNRKAHWSGPSGCLQTKLTQTLVLLGAFLIITMTPSRFIHSHNVLTFRSSPCQSFYVYAMLRRATAFQVRELSFLSFQDCLRPSSPRFASRKNGIVSPLLPIRSLSISLLISSLPTNPYSEFSALKQGAVAEPLTASRSSGAPGTQ
jgi:hypothetical protein